MSTPTQTETAPNDKEYNFAQMRKRLDQSEAARVQAEQEVERLRNETNESNGDDFVDKKSFNKSLSQSESKIVDKLDKKTEQRIQDAINQERRSAWLKANPDFQEVIQHAPKIFELDSELAESIVSNPDEFEKQKLAYKTVKHLGLHKPKETPQDIQAKIEANKKNAAYQPSQIGSAPYANTGDFSAAGQKTSYEHMKALQGRLGIR